MVVSYMQKQHIQDATVQMDSTLGLTLLVHTDLLSTKNKHITSILQLLQLRFLVQIQTDLTGSKNWE